MERVRCYAFLWVLSWTRNIARFHSILSVSLNSVFERRDIFSLYFFLFFLFFPCVRAFTRLSTPFPLPSPRFFRSIYFLSRFNRWPANDVPGLVAPPPPSFFSFLVVIFFVSLSFFLFLISFFPSLRPSLVSPLSLVELARPITNFPNIINVRFSPSPSPSLFLSVPHCLGQ